MATLKLFDSDGDSSDNDHSKIEINHEFAKRYEHNKKREELQKYEELKKKGLINSLESNSEESSSEGEELENPSKIIDAEFFDALIKVKNQDPILRKKDAKLFNSDDENEEGDASKKKVKKEKPMYLKDVVSKHLIEGGPEFSDEEIESEDDGGIKNRVKSYAEEQEEMRQGFLKALQEEENDDDGGDLLRVKSSGNDDEEDEDDEIGDKLDEYFGEDEKLDDDMMFLKDYFRNRMWADDVKGKRDAGDVDVDVSEDEEEIEKQEDYEREYNFRFEENAGDRVMGYSRKVEGSVRKKDNARKLQRERKEERMAQAELERREELKRLKNLKKKEINEKLEKIREVAGIGKNKEIFDKDDLEEEFDPEAHDKKMKEAFGEDYYEEEDVDPEFGSDAEKPDFDKEDELLGLEEDWDKVDKVGEGFVSARERILKGRVVDGVENLVDEDGDVEPKEGKRKRKRKPSDVEKAVMEELLDEYYKLDYEDTIGDLKTRFKYKPVKAKRYGLSAEEVLMLDDKELNQYVSIKKLAPYREKEWEVPRIKTIQLKKSKQYLKGNTSQTGNEDMKGKHHKDKVKEKEVKAVESERSQSVEPNMVSNGEKETISRKKRRKQNQAELKLSQSRLMAYGKIASKSKSKKH